MTKHTDAIRFLQAVFGDDYERFAILANLNPAVHVRTLGELDAARDCYWSVAAFASGHVSRTTDRATEVRALVIDDVGTKVQAVAVEMALGTPTAIVLTSAGNYQWAYRLARPVAVADWPRLFAEVERRVGQKLEGRDAVHLFRLPMGINTKPGRDSAAVRLIELNPGIELGIDVPPARPAPAPVAPASGTLRRAALEGLMAHIPNGIDLDRGAWVEIGHGLKALCAEDDEGFAVFDAWSQQHDSYDAGKTLIAWDSFGAGGLLTKGGMLRARAEALDPDGFRRWAAAVAFDDGAAPPPAAATVTFALGANNQILSTMDNAARALLGLEAGCKYDAFHHRFYVRGERLTDHMVLMLRVEINGRYGKDFGDKNVLDAITALGLKDQFNPVTDMLSVAEAIWDGVKRLDRLGPDYFHTEDTPLAWACFRKVMIAAVRRARSPGVKFDQILVLESPEGWDKSTAWACLAGEENFSDASILGKDARAVQEELADIWIHEIADLSGLARAEVEAVKAFASRTNDRARPAYGKVLIDQPRQSIEVGTTNSDSYLMAQTGNRRFWPFLMGSRVDMGLLREDRLQLWGEAARAESAGETLVLDRSLWDVAAVAQEDRRVVDPWEDELANLPEGLFKEVHLFGARYLTISNVAIHDYLGGHRGAQINGASGRKIAEIMKRLGWERSYLKDAVGAKVRGYKRRTDSTDATAAPVPKNLF